MRKRDLALVFGIFAGGYMAGDAHLLDDLKDKHIGFNIPTATPSDLIQATNAVGLKNARTESRYLGLCQTAKRIGFKAEDSNNKPVHGAVCIPESGETFVVLKTATP